MGIEDIGLKRLRVFKGWTGGVVRVGRIQRGRTVCAISREENSVGQSEEGR